MVFLNHSNSKILIVEDSEMYASFLYYVLGQEYTCDVALNGLVAIQKACDSPPDLILLDIVMPEMDGYKLCRVLKKNEITRDIPIIFMTSKDRAEDETKGLNLGAVDYITKPFHIPIVKARINNHLKTQSLLKKLHSALHEVKIIKGLLPICTNCKKIQDNQGNWHKLEDYISSISEISFSEQLCPNCRKKLMPKKGKASLSPKKSF